MGLKTVLFLVLASVVAINSLYVGCGANKKQVECASPCGPTCQNPNPNPFGACTASCKTCICIDGYLEDELSRECVEVSKCPPKQLN